MRYLVSSFDFFICLSRLIRLFTKSFITKPLVTKSLRRVFFLALIGLSWSVAHAKPQAKAQSQDLGKSSKLSVFQKEILSCFEEKLKSLDTKNLNIKGLKTMNDLYKELENNFSLISSETISRETIYETDRQTKKLKLEQSKISQYLVKSDGTLEVINVDARQQGLTDEGRMNQILFKVKIKSDWQSVREKRERLSTLEYRKQDGKIIYLSFSSEKLKNNLECQVKEDLDICLCQKKP